jgi:carbonic anhydrase
MHSHKLSTIAATLLLGSALALAKDTAAPNAAMTKEAQAELTPAEAFARLKAGNERFASGQPLRRDLLAQVKQTSTGQFPFAAIVSCLDSRASAELIFDLNLGDAFNARLAGNVIEDEVLGSLEFATKVVGAKVIAVIGHTQCGAVIGASNDVKLGHLTRLLGHLEGAVTAVEKQTGKKRDGNNPQFVEQVAEKHVRLGMKALTERSEILKSLADEGRVMIVGGIYDLATGRVNWLE